MKVAVVMPAWNEVEGIEEFVGELASALDEWSPCFVIVDDASTDATWDRVTGLSESSLDIRAVRNTTNLGHGPSTVKGLELAIPLAFDAVLAIDGDGQFRGQDVARVVRTLFDDQVEVVEGVRVGRDDPFFRKWVSLCTRILIWSRSKQWPKDANTPLRAYRPSTLSQLLDAIPTGAATPNLLISATCRRWGTPILEVQVASIPRRGSTAEGSTWGARRRSIPSRRFVSFCAQATREWVGTRVPEDRPVDS